MTTDTNGIILLNKSAGLTSFKALGTLKKKLKEYSGAKVKVGHTGTLDSFAEGLLVVLAGRFTRLNPVFTAFDKSYEADIIFGTETNTLDPAGDTIKTAEIPEYKTIESVLPSFQGAVRQRPPIFSAVHVNGERAYKKALNGTITELPERDVHIYNFEIIDWTSPVLKCRIDCSKGTYIRSIARDLGRLSGSCAHLRALTRISVGPFNLADSIKAEDFNPSEHLIRGRGTFEKLGKSDALHFRIIETDVDGAAKLRQGVTIRDSFFKIPPKDNGSYAVFIDDDFIAYIKYENGKYSYHFVG
ncbi:MAG: tRNA pseudouridine(55) synthase TruB [Spirochaetales bacterium]|uniref:tRNA pseudouridine synthase B n=1 Tax=Candidatus Thalassospirochaeta sargassi TaxID=3119039 RepID=A0AAJ1IAW7_9SPIO|nr:tRNA pseudouridine(55) synthase TruB [Spirochaetales bacterium]